MKLLKSRTPDHESQEALTTPLFSMEVLDHVKNNRVFIGLGKPSSYTTQYGLLAGIVGSSAIESSLNVYSDSSDSLTDAVTGLSIAEDKKDIRVFYNVSAPSSTFICGSQGSGKSHTLSCLLESCLVPSVANVLPSPLCGVVFHYDTFVSDDGGSPCEAAWLSSNPNLTVRVLCSPTNMRTMKVSTDNIQSKVTNLMTEHICQL